MIILSRPEPRLTTAPTDSLNIYGSSITGTNTTTIKSKLDFYMVQYNRNGEVLDIKPLTNELFPSVTTPEDLVEFQSFGKNLLKQTPNTTSSNEYFFDIFVLDSNRSFVEVPITLS